MADGTSKTIKQQAGSATNKILEGLEKLSEIAPKLSSEERSEIFNAIDSGSRLTLQTLSTTTEAKKKKFEFKG